MSRSCKKHCIDVASLTDAFRNATGKAGQMSHVQSFRVAAEIIRCAPSNVLIFGAGDDTALYVQANAGGRTVVLEHHEKWRAYIAHLPCQVVPVGYSTQLKNSLVPEIELPNGLPSELFQMYWSVILIDSPEGYAPEMPGRQQSIYAAACLATEKTTTFLHDYNRPLERGAAERYLGVPSDVIGQVPSLAVFHGNRKRPSHQSDSVCRNDAMEKCDVSVVIPNFNEGKWLEWTVDALLAAVTDLKQEIIVFDDASTDGSVDRIRDHPLVRVISVGSTPVGCVVGRNRAAAAARGEYLCFLDGHVLVRDHWLDYLRETSQKFADRALVSGNILNARKQGDPSVEREQYAYTLKNWTTSSEWHFHGHAVKKEPYMAPLCPAGLMFVRRAHFWNLGGFSECIRRWGGTDVEISLKNYMFGGENVVDPRVIVYHNYKNLTDNKRTFSISYRETFFNRLFIAKAFGSRDVYEGAKRYLAQHSDINLIVEELESGKYDTEIEGMQKKFVRNWEDFEEVFSQELSGCVGAKEVAV